MAALSDLEQVLMHLSPARQEGFFVFATVQNLPEGIVPVASFVEEEGISIIVHQQTADERELSYSEVFGQITLQVQSSLTGVGLTAVVTTALAKENISCNVVAGHFHDHLFIPIEMIDRALEILQRLQTRNESPQ